ncbi:dTMP kinase [Corynebacterium kroppenstedtii]|uniref:dTMP kinase n=1 Tax=Corynebacterium sp. PCR 32 TaxID=3351342 RepID=UPI0030ADB641
MLVACEGIDGAGKNTLVTAVEKELLARDRPVARVAFPRYDDSAHAQLARCALYGEMGDLMESAYGMATLFALDRAEIAEDLAELSADGYIVLIDRFVASNAAYTAARQGWDGSTPSDADPVVTWVAELEFDRLGIPIPDLHIFLSTPPQIAAKRARDREDADATRARDAYERDSALQQRTAAAYEALARDQWQSPWIVVAPDDPDQQLIRVVDAIMNHT